MSEPVTLYRDGDEVIVTAPSEVRRMLADGWSLTDDYVPFAFRDDKNYVNESDFINITRPLEFGTVDTDAPIPVPQMNVTPVKRGRPRKAQM